MEDATQRNLLYQRQLIEDGPGTYSEELMGDDEIFGFHAFNDSTFCYLCYNHGEIGNFYLTKNYGMSWETFDLPGSIVGINCAYIGNKIAVPLHDKRYCFKKCV